MQKVVVNYDRLTELELSERAAKVCSSMKENAHFPDPEPSVAEIEAVLTEYNDAIVKADGGTKADTAHKNNLKAQMCVLLNDLASFVNLKAKGDDEKLDSSGFTLTKPQQKIHILSAPQSIKLSDGDAEGEIKTDIAKVDKADGYVVMYISEGDLNEGKAWQSIIQPNTRGVVSGLQNVTKYHFKAAAISKQASKENRYNFSNTFSRVVQ